MRPSLEPKPWMTKIFFSPFFCFAKKKQKGDPRDITSPRGNSSVPQTTWLLKAKAM